MDKQSYLSNSDPVYIDDLYKKYLQDNSSVEDTWAKFFEGFEFARKSYSDAVGGEVPEQVRKEFSVLNLINLYRSSGHLFTNTNPVRERRKYYPTLDEIELIGLSEDDLNTVFNAGVEVGLGPAKLSDIIELLKQTYCQSIGVEYTHIRNQKVVKWLQEKMESTRNTPNFSTEQKKRILGEISKAVVFESFLHTKFVGEKRFSLEGVESTIPAIDAIIEKGAELGIQEFVIGMAHRGRLNVLANILKKTYEDIFTEFEGKEFDADALFGGDVKYHLGYSSNVITKEGQKVHLSLTPNPSHLETVGAVAEGITRAKLDKSYNGDFSKVAPIIIHGDAAIAGQGIVYEIVQMAKLKAYRNGGTIHVVTNNQIGFTTNYVDARSSTYCTDVAKVILSPVFHVNADDVEAVVHTVRLAMEFRQAFHRDVFIDLLGYRKYGHNEGDEPRFTQPLLYKLIATHPDPRKIYLDKLSSEGLVNSDDLKKIEDEFKQSLQERLDESKQIRKTRVTSFLEGVWKGLRLAEDKDFDQSPDTSVVQKTLLDIGEKITDLPKDKNFFTKIIKLQGDRKNMLKGEGAIDWGMAELLAYGSLITEGFPVRFSGQDVERGTFSHRHAVLTVTDSEEEYVPLNHLSDKQVPFEIYNSHLSEYAVLGFEYGYAMASPQSLTIWEAQFGDFANGAQIIIDQYISAAEDKWRRMNNICLFLPHGYEGQGAEHSSARMERFLMLCAENNMYVINATTPANFFHAIRRQLHVPFRKPLIAFTPKSLLRHPRCISKLTDFTKGGFSEILDDGNTAATKLVFCCGKVYYDLLDAKEKSGAKDIALIRMEQLYPFPKKQFTAILSKYKKAKSYLWVQEEPENMGAWLYMTRMVKEIEWTRVSRPESASPATGSKKHSEIEKQAILEAVFGKVLVK
ncbi:MAG TPA: 2-oxoglutarate dehydrogenase E1 component [Bacteroidia bacterium]|jgi:2-oxoglutarate dehydrogenase E1 component|nr:2-oxoglutarate dehydrogenase E1 component [Bacteroidia bacterium]